MSESPTSGLPQHSTIDKHTLSPSIAHQTGQLNGDPMDTTPTAAGSMRPPVHSSPETDPHAPLTNGAPSEHMPSQTANPGGGLSAAAATASPQPKVVQTAFIHKLYR